MIKITTIDGRERYFNLNSIESFDPKENEVVLVDGRVLIIEPQLSDVSVLTGGAVSNVVEEISDKV